MTVNGLAETIDLDLSGLKCPLPVLRTRRALARLSAGQTLRVTCTDPLSTLDIPNLVREEGDVLVGIDRIGSTLRFEIRRAKRRDGHFMTADATTPDRPPH